MVTKNLVTDYLAVHDGQTVFDSNFQITVGTAALHYTAGNIFTGSTGKSIVANIGVGPGGGSNIFGTINSVTGGGSTANLSASADGTLPDGGAHVVSWGTDNLASFVAFTGAYQGATVTLTIDSGVYLISNPGDVGQLFDGITNLTVNASGATLAGHIIQLGAGGGYQDNEHSARTQAASAGDTFITLITKPQTTCVSYADNGSGQVRLRVASTAGYVTGDKINIQGCTPSFTSLNSGFLLVTVVDGTHFDIDDTDQPNLSYATVLAYDAPNGTNVSAAVVGHVTDIFTVGHPVRMTGFDRQAGGYPPSHHWHEFLTVTAIDNNPVSPTYGKITFSTPLVNSYLATWPVYNDGRPANTGQSDNGGPGTLYALLPSFEYTGVINGPLTIACSNQSTISGRKVTFNNVTFVGAGNCGGFPTMAGSVFLNNCVGADAHMEVDKNVDYVEMTGCTWAGIAFQSADPTTFVIDSSTIIDIAGSAYRTYIRNGSSVDNITPGPGYGYSQILDVRDSTVASFGSGAGHNSGASHVGPNGANVDWPMTSGVIFIANSFFAGGVISQFAIAGAKIFLLDFLGPGILGSFTITNVTQDASGIYLHTDWTKNGGAYPARTYGAQSLRLMTHPAPDCTFVNVTGCPEVVSLSKAPAHTPLYSYFETTYTGDIVTGPSWPMYGRFKYLKISVTKAYSGATGTVQAFLHNANVVLNSDGTDAAAWHQFIDLKHTGDRIFDARAKTYPVAWTGAAGADVLTGQSVALWNAGNFNMSMTDISAESPANWPAFTIQFITDQELGRTFTCTFT